MDLGDVLAALESIAPLRFAEPWDNVGLLAGDPARPSSAALLAIDYTPEVAREARELGCDLVIAYHPPLFEPLKRVVAPSPIFEAIRDGIALYSPHTALDVVAGGTNDLLADILDLRLAERAPLRRAAAKPSSELAVEAPAVGLGRIGPLGKPASVGELLVRIKRELDVGALLVAGPAERVIARAATCAGAGGALLEDAIAQGAELYLTGELRHHDALRAARAGVTVVCALHSNSERAALKRVARRLEELLPGLRVAVSVQDRDPFSIR